MSWYRCRAKVGDGEYTSYTGPDLDQALTSMDQHVWAREVIVEEMAGLTDWGEVQWEQVSMVTRASVPQSQKYKDLMSELLRREGA